MRAFPLVAFSTLLLPALLSGCAFGLTEMDPGEGVDGAEGPDSPSVQDDESDGDADALPETAVDLSGSLYAIEPTSMNVVDPPGLDALFDQVLTRDVLVYVESATDRALQLDVALAGGDGRQDRCEAVRRFPSGDWSENPVFDVGPGELTTSFAGHAAAFRSLELSGVFDASGAAWSDGVLLAQLDTRELAPALNQTGDLCPLVESLGGTCEPCDDGAVACFTLRIEGMVGDRLDSAFDPDVDGNGC
jgi:hypothetical protein